MGLMLTKPEWETERNRNTQIPSGLKNSFSVSTLLLEADKTMFLVTLLLLASQSSRSYVYLRKRTRFLSHTHNTCALPYPFPSGICAPILTVHVC